jgi:Phage integrase, N-terminal SAM-like domain
MDTTITKTPVNPLRQRMQHDMMMRGLGPHTQHDYIRHARRLSAFLGRPPDTATVDDLRSFQIHQHEQCLDDQWRGLGAAFFLRRDTQAAAPCSQAG